MPDKRGRSTTFDEPSGSVEARFGRALRTRPDLLPKGSSVLIAFSGGSDSLALLRLLCAVRRSHGLDLIAAHFDHGLQAESAERAAWAAAACGHAGLRCELGAAKGLAGGQAEYREARYEFLAEVRERVGADRVALGHQRDDHLETVFLNLLRGTGVRGLAGIPARRGAIVRPLLGFGRAELQSYLRTGGHEWLEDPANRDPRYGRSRVRHELVPTLAEHAGAGVLRTVDELSRHAFEADAGLESQAGRLLVGAEYEETSDGAQIARSRLRAYDRASRARMLRKIARDMGFRLSRRGTEGALAFIRKGASGRGVDVADGLRVEREFDRIRFRRARSKPVDRELEIEAAEAGAERVRLGGRSYGVRWGALDGTERWFAVIARSALRFPLRVRGPRPGDRIRTRAGSRKVKKLLNERRVPASERSAVPIVVDAEERVLWVVGHAAQYAAEAGTEGESFAIGVIER